MFAVGDRVTHVDKLTPGAVLPMTGEVVGVQTRYLVRWDGDEPRPMSGWVPTLAYPADDLRPLGGPARIRTVRPDEEQR